MFSASEQVLLRGISAFVFLSVQGVSLLLSSLFCFFTHNIPVTSSELYTPPVFVCLSLVAVIVTKTSCVCSFVLNSLSATKTSCVCSFVLNSYDK